jgi:NADPH:quinone reductase-like Zn-dependent oxidoreductase
MAFLFHATGESLSFAEVASLPIAGCTALQALRDLRKLSVGANALILGGAWSKDEHHLRTF